MTQQVGNLRFRPIRPPDLELLLAWRSNPAIYDQFKEQTAPPSWEDHLNWFASRPNDRSDYLIEYCGRRVGSVFVDEDGYVGVYVGETDLWGRGIASNAVEWLCDRADDSSGLYAEIHADNDASCRVFEKCGFEVHRREGEWLVYRFAAENTHR